MTVPSLYQCPTCGTVERCIRKAVGWVDTAGLVDAWDERLEEDAEEWLEIADASDVCPDDNDVAEEIDP